MILSAPCFTQLDLKLSELKGGSRDDRGRESADADAGVDIVDIVFAR